MPADRLEQALAGVFGYLDAIAWFASRQRNPLGLDALDADTELPALIFEDGGDQASGIESGRRLLEARAAVWLVVASETPVQLGTLLNEARARLLQGLFSAWDASPLRGTLIEDIRYAGSDDPILDQAGQFRASQAFDLVIVLSESETDPYSL